VIALQSSSVSVLRQGLQILLTIQVDSVSEMVRKKSGSEVQKVLGGTIEAGIQCQQVLPSMKQV